jgi:hypothetical protein
MSKIYITANFPTGFRTGTFELSQDSEGFYVIVSSERIPTAGSSVKVRLLPEHVKPMKIRGADYLYMKPITVPRIQDN